MAGKKSRSGRKRIEIEKADYKDLISLFYGKENLAKLSKKIEAGKYSPRDYMKYEIMGSKGKEARQTILKKLFPDSVINDVNLTGDFEGIKLDI